MTKKLVLAVMALGLMAVGAEAHPGHGATGFMAGLAHPFTGLDHMIAMMAVGLFAARLGGKAIWMVPLSFVGLLAVGGAWGMAGMFLPVAESIVLLSVAVLPAVAVMRWKANVATACALVGIFALFHGYAHGLELPDGLSGLSYAAGFVTASVSLHVVGIGLGLGLYRLHQKLA